jgi:glycosyltransferase involved in cell wall biosynthesis
MGFIFETIYFGIVIICFFYLFILYQNSKTEWEIIETNDDNLPFVSIIVPTMEEERNIENCLESLTKLDYPKKEIIVVDGGSTDRTVEIAKQYPVKVIVDPSLPHPWIGKSYGCHLGYNSSKGDVLLFTDADTVHKPESLRVTVSHLLGTESVLFSMLPYQKCEKWYEYFVSYFFFFAYLVGGPLNNINNQYNKDSYLAIGQYMLFTREGYEELGGHLAVNSTLVEDFAFAKLCKEKEMKLYFRNETYLVQTRMYPTNFRDFYHGFKKSIAGGLTTARPWRIFFIILWLIYIVSSPYFLISSFFRRAEGWLLFDFSIGIIVNIIIYLACAAAIWWYWRKKIDIFMILIAIYSRIRGQKVLWKTRLYSAKELQSQK